MTINGEAPSPLPFHLTDTMPHGDKSGEHLVFHSWVAGLLPSTLCISCGGHMWNIHRHKESYSHFSKGHSSEARHCPSPTHTPLIPQMAAAAESTNSIAQSRFHFHCPRKRLQWVWLSSANGYVIRLMVQLLYQHPASAKAASTLWLGTTPETRVATNYHGQRPIHTIMLCTQAACYAKCRTVKGGVFAAEEKGSYDHIVVNNDLDVAYEKLKGILIKVSAFHKMLHVSVNRKD